MAYYVDLPFRDREVVYNLLGTAGFTGGWEERIFEWAGVLGLTSTSIPDILHEAFEAGFLTDGL